jgi:hypothetical protein
MKYTKIIIEDSSISGIYEKMIQQVIKYVRERGGINVTEDSILFDPDHSRMAVIKLDTYISGTKTLSETVAKAIKEFIDNRYKYRYKINNISTEKL